MFYRLVTVTPRDLEGPRSRTLQLPATIGRNPDQDISINHDSISRTHCRLVLNGEGVLTVQDLNSMNGTYVDDRKVQRAELHPGEILQIGAVRFRVEYGSDTDHGLADASEPVYELSETVPMKQVSRGPAVPRSAVESRSGSSSSGSALSGSSPPTPSGKRWWEFWKP